MSDDPTGPAREKMPAQLAADGLETGWNLWQRSLAAVGILLALVLGGVLIQYLGTRREERQHEAPPPPPGTAVVRISVAGATLPAPLYEEWFKQYHSRHPGVAPQYQVVGSGEGVRLFEHGQVLIGASDRAMTDHEVEKVSRGVQFIPATAGAVVLAYNVPGVNGDLKLARDVYVDIFLGKIKHWDDNRIKASNDGLNLPKLPITLVVRLDASGTTSAFTNHLSAVSDAWKNGPGAGQTVQWPGTPIQAKGNAGVAGEIKRTPGAIGYVEYGTAERAELALATLQNRHGKFVAPTSQAFTRTLAQIKLPPNLRAFVYDPEGESAYPIVTYSWLLLNKRYDSAAEAAAVRELVRWCLVDGQAYSSGLGFVRLPPEVTDQGLAALRSVGP